MITFGEYIRNLRIENNLTLREFCKSAKLDPSNWSKIERGIAPPPKSKIILHGIAEILHIDDTEYFPFGKKSASLLDIDLWVHFWPLGSRGSNRKRVSIKPHSLGIPYSS